MSEIYDLVKAYFDAQGLFYNEIEGRKHLVLCFSDDDTDAGDFVHLMFDRNSVQFGMGRLFELTDENIGIAFRTCSDMNRNLRFVKFHVSRENESILAIADMVCNTESCAEQVYDLMMVFMSNAIQGYSTFGERLPVIM